MLACAPGKLVGGTTAFAYSFWLRDGAKTWARARRTHLVTAADAGHALVCAGDRHQRRRRLRSGSQRARVDRGGLPPVARVLGVALNRRAQRHGALQGDR